MDNRKRREIYGQIAWIAVVTIAMAWIAFAWTATTGLTFVSSYQRGRIARPEDETYAKHVAVLTTVVALPVALWAASQRGRTPEE